MTMILTRLMSRSSYFQGRVILLRFRETVNTAVAEVLGRLRVATSRVAMWGANPTVREAQFVDLPEAP